MSAPSIYDLHSNDNSRATRELREQFIGYSRPAKQDFGKSIAKYKKVSTQLISSAARRHAVHKKVVTHYNARSEHNRRLVSAAHHSPQALAPDLPAAVHTTVRPRSGSDCNK